MQLVLALANKSLFEEFSRKRNEFIEEQELEKMRLQHRLEKLKLLNIPHPSLSLNQTHKIPSSQNQLKLEKLSKKKLEQTVCQWSEDKSCKVCQSRVSMLPMYSSSKRHHCRICGCSVCGECIISKEDVKMCTKCLDILFQNNSCSSPQIELSHKSVSLEYQTFRSLRFQIENAIAKYQEKPNSDTRNEILSLFADFEDKKLIISQLFSLLCPVLHRNFEHFCILFYQEHKFTLKNQIVEGKFNRIETEEMAIFEQQAHYLRSQIEHAIRTGKIEDALSLRESLSEIEIVLDQKTLKKTK